MEVWKKLKEFPLYSISTHGRIRNDVRGTIKELTESYYGYAVVCLSRGDGTHKTVLVHRLMADTFMENPFDLPEINHKDGNKMNPRLDNLEWCTYSENIRHAVRELGKMTGPRPHCRPVICLELWKQFDSIRAAAIATGCSTREIRRCIENPDKLYYAKGLCFVAA